MILDKVLIDDYWKYIENIAFLWLSFSILIDCKIYPRNLRTNNCVFAKILVFLLVLSLNLFTKIKRFRNFRTNHWILWQREGSRIEHFLESSKMFQCFGCRCLVHKLSIRRQPKEKWIKEINVLQHFKHTGDMFKKILQKRNFFVFVLLLWLSTTFGLSLIPNVF